MLFAGQRNMGPEGTITDITTLAMNKSDRQSPPCANSASSMLPSSVSDRSIFHNITYQKKKINTAARVQKEKNIQRQNNLRRLQSWQKLQGRSSRSEAPTPDSCKINTPLTGRSKDRSSGANNGTNSGSTSKNSNSSRKSSPYTRMVDNLRSQTVQTRKDEAWQLLTGRNQPKGSPKRANREKGPLQPQQRHQRRTPTPVPSNENENTLNASAGSDSRTIKTSGKKNISIIERAARKGRVGRGKIVERMEEKEGKETEELTNNEKRRKSNSRSNSSNNRRRRPNMTSNTTNQSRTVENRAEGKAQETKLNENKTADLKEFKDAREFVDAKEFKDAPEFKDDDGPNEPKPPDGRPPRTGRLSRFRMPESSLSNSPSEFVRRPPRRSRIQQLRDQEDGGKMKRNDCSRKRSPLAPIDTKVNQLSSTPSNFSLKKRILSTPSSIGTTTTNRTPTSPKETPEVGLEPSLSPSLSPSSKMVSPTTPTPSTGKNEEDDSTSLVESIPKLPSRSPFYSHTRVIMGLSERKTTSSIVQSPSSSNTHVMNMHNDQADVIEQVILVAGKVRPVPTVAVQFRQRGLPKGMLRLVEVEIPIVPKPYKKSTKRFVQERTEIVLSRLTNEAPGFSSVAPYQLRKILNQLLIASIHSSPTSITSTTTE
jgi:hypothetical protein